MPILKGAASDVTRYRKLNAQSLAPTKKLTQSSVPPATLLLNGTIGATAKATAIAASVAPKTSVVTQSTPVAPGKKRG